MGSVHFGLLAGSPENLNDRPVRTYTSYTEKMGENKDENGIDKNWIWVLKL